MKRIGRKRRRVKTDRENELGSHSKEGLEPLEAEEEKKKFPLAPAGGARPCCHLILEHLASRTVQQDISVVLSHEVCANLLCQPWEINKRPCHCQLSPSPAMELIFRNPVSGNVLIIYQILSCNWIIYVFIPSSSGG